MQKLKRYGLVASFVIAVILLIAGCGVEEDESDNGDESSDDGQNAAMLPPGVRLIIAGEGGLFEATADGFSLLINNEDKTCRRALPMPEEESLLVVANNHEINEGILIKYQPDEETLSEVTLPEYLDSFLLKGATFDDQDRLWVVGADQDAGTGLLLVREDGSWRRIEVDRVCGEGRWQLTTLAQSEDRMFFFGFDEEEHYDMHFVLEEGMDRSEQACERLSGERHFIPRRFYRLKNNYPSLWLTGSYMEARFDPMYFLPEPTSFFTVAGSCSLSLHRNYWIGEVGGRILVTGSICPDEEPHEIFPASYEHDDLPCSEEDMAPMLVQYDMDYIDPYDGPGFHWRQFIIDLPDGKALYHVKEIDLNFYFLYEAHDGYLYLYNESAEQAFRLTNKLSHVHSVRYVVD